MNLATGIVLLAVLAIAGLALRSVIKRVKRGDLCGTCGQSCGGACGHCSAARGGDSPCSQCGEAQRS